MDGGTEEYDRSLLRVAGGECEVGGRGGVTGSQQACLRKEGKKGLTGEAGRREGKECAVQQKGRRRHGGNAAG